jgi:hypothetical protein
MPANTNFTVNNLSRPDGVVRRSSGSITFPSTSISGTDFVSIECGFIAKYVKFVNATDRIIVEYYQGMADDTCIKTAAAGTVTLETTNKGVTVSGNSFSVSQNINLAVIAPSKVCYWIAEG